MNRFPQKRFTKSLSSGLFIFALCVAGYSSSGSIAEAKPLDDPATLQKSSEGKSIEIPGSFKELPGVKDAVTAKRAVGEITLTSAKPLVVTQLAIDESKVASSNRSLVDRSMTNRPTVNRPSVANNPPAVTAPSVINNSVDAEGEFQEFHATAYCLKGRTASGATATTGMIAADPRVLPLGTVVHISAGRYTGQYTVTDTGGRIKGRVIDVYLPNYREAMLFGRRQVKIKVVGRIGSNNSQSSKKTVMADVR
jgi:3D (Asp-Asp-Asp) domain-containing protein